MSEPWPGRLLEGHKDAIECVRESPFSHDLLLSGSEDSTVRLWDVRVFRSVRAIRGIFSGSSISSVCFHTLAEHCVLVSFGRELACFDLRSPALVLSAAALPPCCFHTDDITHFSVHQNGELIASGDDSGTARIISFDPSGTTQPSQLQSIAAHSDVCYALFNPSCPSELLTGGFDCCVKFWDHNRAHCLSTINLATDPTVSNQQFNPPFVHALQVCSDKLAVALGSGEVAIVDLPSRRLRHRVTLHTGLATALASSGCSGLYSAGNDGCVYRWAQDLSQPIGRYVHDRKINALASLAHHELVAIADTSAQLALFPTHSFTSYSVPREALNIASSSVSSGGGGRKKRRQKTKNPRS
eukprot:gnl/Spiro4/15650_TR8411_c0_g1_i1.p1 gnl/Spiro4/15650_TR8411_c0_g1~~gnl/Spiro4/15650_TR8411_c0_g1_i1.p1  ORF type:complete len:356 (+),score=29.52 gnl/Spiro4/15650_TR8411_c0_g1_i1:185-1252(+)